ncbi:MAG: HD family phosphohydrolase [Eubacteriaceae bacterium]|nr:HD family phosphohydrolase [Eubacteriaceae bacterium]
MFKQPFFDVSAICGRVDEYVDEMKPLLTHPIIQQMKSFRHHYQINCFEHSVHVSYISYWACKKLSLDCHSAGRGGLLHDLYLYDCKVAKRYEHLSCHSKAALKNAQDYFALNEIERDIVSKHMWPLTISLPKYPESFIVSMVDKYCSLKEYAAMKDEIIRVSSIESALVGV